jgi:hypothetical protein
VSLPFASAIVVAWALLLMALAMHAAAGDWWELALLALIGAGFVGVVVVRRTIT